MDNQEQETIRGEDRTATSLPDKAGKRKASGLMILAGGLLLLGILVVPKLLIGKKEPVVQQAEQDEAVSVVRRDDFKTDIDPQSVEDVQQLVIEDDRPPVKIGEPVITEESPKLTISKSIGTMMVASKSNPLGNTGDMMTDNAIADAQNRANALTQQSGSNAQSSGGDMFKAPVFAAAKAKKSTFNPHLLLSRGTVIQCSLRGRLVSNIGGQIGCIVADDVYSQSGAVVLIEKGSLIDGYYQGNNVSHGHSEIFAVWSEIRTPNNLVIPLESGSVDALGANGLHGWVDNHFWERFQNAILLSLIEDTFGVLANNASKQQSYDYTENTRERTNDMAKTVLEQMGDIKPTLYMNQGDKVGVFVARDIDFSGVYNLRMSR